MFKVIILGLIATIVLLATFSILDSGTVAGVDVVGNTTSAAEGTVSVTISGEVVYPGTYLVEEGATLSDLIDAASGETSNADDRCYNLDYEIEEGMTFYIAPIYDNSDVCAVTPIDKVNINEDDKSTLMTVSSIGSVIASNIISYREDEGEFLALEEIKNVSGIGNATFEKIKDYIMLKD